MKNIFWNGWTLEDEHVSLPGRHLFPRENLNDPTKMAAVLLDLYETGGTLDAVLGLVNLLHQTSALRAWMGGQEEAGGKSGILISITRKMTFLQDELLRLADLHEMEQMGGADAPRRVGVLRDAAEICGGCADNARTAIVERGEVNE